MPHSETKAARRCPHDEDRWGKADGVEVDDSGIELFFFLFFCCVDLSESAWREDGKEREIRKKEAHGVTKSILP
jgi:hypothetical protein